MTRMQLPEQGGYIVLPKNVGIGCAVTFLVWLLGATWFGATEFTTIKARMADVEKATAKHDAEIQARAKLQDERFEQLRSRDDRIVRLEEQQKVTNELLREIRAQLARTRP